MKWFFMKGPGGTIICKGNFAAEAKAEAAERWDCGADEIEVTGEEPYYGSGERVPGRTDFSTALEMTGRQRM